MAERTQTLLVTRYRPGEDSAPTQQAYTVPYHEHWVVLDALNYVKDKLDGSLSYRWSCRMGVCGSCGMMVNGEPKLSCSVFLRDYYPKPVTVEPLNHFPIMRDLVIDMSGFLDKLQSVEPWIVREEEQPVSEGEYRQTPKQLEAYKQFTQCINCMLCYSACPVFGLDSSFVGPAAIALAHRYNEDSRDQGKSRRREVLSAHQGIWECTFVGECSVVCPKHVDPAAAIQRFKVDTAKEWMQSMLMPWGRR